MPSALGRKKRHGAPRAPPAVSDVVKLTAGPIRTTGPRNGCDLGRRSRIHRTAITICRPTRNGCESAGTIPCLGGQRGVAVPACGPPLPRAVCWHRCDLDLPPSR